MGKTKSAGLIVKEFLQDGGEPVAMSEFRDFWKACDESDKADFAAEAATALGYVKTTDGKFSN